jgi:glycosyltransferase involved in cell wall biosynthesis
MPRAVLGLPMYRSEGSVARAIGSLLMQDYEDFAIVAIDDCSPGRTLEIAKALARTDSRIVVEANAKRLGMIANWNRVLDRSRELHGEFDFFAWASDNDLREPSWLSALVRALDENPAAALAYTRLGTVDGGTKTAPTAAPSLEARGGDPVARFRRVIQGINAGAVIYGLHRRATLDLAGGIPRVLLADALFLSQLSLYGEFVQEPQVLWYRSHGGTGGSRSRQRRALFARSPPATFAPVVLQHTFWLVGSMVFAGRRPAGIGRLQALRIGVLYLTTRLNAAVEKRRRSWRKRQTLALRRWHRAEKAALRRWNRVEKAALRRWSRAEKTIHRRAGKIRKARARPRYRYSLRSPLVRRKARPRRHVGEIEIRPKAAKLHKSIAHFAEELADAVAQARTVGELATTTDQLRRFRSLVSEKAEATAAGLERTVASASKLEADAANLLELIDRARIDDDES